MRKLLATVGVFLVCAKRTKYWKPFVTGLQFIIHFISVMLILMCGAIVLAVLEDPDVMYGKDANALQEKNESHSNSTRSGKSANKTHNVGTHISAHDAHFWKSMQAKYNFTIRHEFQGLFLEDVGRYQQKNCKQPTQHHGTAHFHKHISNRHFVRDRKFIFMKWFYFAIVAVTTIGYGNVYPTTDGGKIFYIFFSIIGIVAMMTLLRSCGKILMTGNKKFYTLVSRCLCKEKEYVSDQLMSVVSMCFFFLVFMLFVVWYDQHIGTHLGGRWSMVDTVYFWLVTFTTVGFGDVHFPLEVEIEHFHELVIYRVFGLSFLAAIIESIHVYIKFRRKLLILHSRPRLRKIAQVIIPERAKIDDEEDTEPPGDVIVSHANFMLDPNRTRGGRR